MAEITSTSQLAGQVRQFDLRRDGVVFLPGALDPNDVTTLKLSADHAYSQVEQWLSGNATGRQRNENSAATDLIQKILDSSWKWGGFAVDNVSALSMDATHPKRRKAYERVIAAADRRLRSELGVPSVEFRSELSYVRRHVGQSTHTPWHFDFYAAGTGVFESCFNVWIPFVEVGSRCPALEFLAGSHLQMRAGAYEYDAPGYPTATWMQTNITPETHFRLNMVPGDIVIFDHHLLHRTQPLAVASTQRTSAELRFVIPPRDCRSKAAERRLFRGRRIRDA